MQSLESLNSWVLLLLTGGLDTGKQKKCKPAQDNPFLPSLLPACLSLLAQEVPSMMINTEG